MGRKTLLGTIGVVTLLAAWTTQTADAQVCNVKVVTDANPDYYDLKSMIRSVTAKWPTPEEKCWAMFYWNHIARRQTSPMILHGLELTDPIRQFNDYGYMMCSTIAGANCAVWHHMGMDVKFWDISLHTVPECFYGGRWHMYDNSMSAVYTLCDGKTIAGVEEIGKEGACAASGGKSEPGHIARYHCLNATSPSGFLTGADCPRDLAQEYRCFRPSGLKYRYYYNNWDWGHRYILNLREGEVYTRYYHSLGDEPRYYVPNGGKDPESPNRRYRIRGNGTWTFRPRLTPAEYKRFIHRADRVEAVDPAGLRPARAAVPAQVVFKVQSANVTTGQTIKADFLRKTEADTASIAVSTTNGLTWNHVWTAEATGRLPVNLKLVDEVNGAYEVLVKVTLQAAGRPDDVQLKRLEIETVTMLNSKTQPSLRLGRNTVYVGLGDQTDSIVVWPDLRAEKYRPLVVEESNIAAERKHPGYQGVIHAIRPDEEAYVVYRVDAPADVTRVTYGGRFYNRAPGAHVRLLHSFDDGKTWKQSYSLTDTKPPWDVIHYATVDEVPAGVRSVLLKYSLGASQAGPDACGIYAARMEVNHRPVAPGFKPMEVTFSWNEVQPDRSLVKRSHTQRIDRVPTRYTISVGGADHPVVDSLRVNLAGAVPDVRYGYSDGRDAGGAKFVDRWLSCGRNLLKGKPYTVSVPPTGQWEGSDPEGTKLTDGIVGPPYAGGIALRYGCAWNPQSGQPEITVDMGKPETIAAFRVHLTAGWPWWDALRGEVKDRIEVFTSTDGRTYRSHGEFNTDVRRTDVPINHLLPDDETAGGWNFEHLLPQPVRARYVKFKITPKRVLGVTEVQALDSVKYEPFDVRIALPDEQIVASSPQPTEGTPR